MPHIIVKLWPGKSEQVKAKLAHQLLEDVMRLTNSAEESVSVAIEEVSAKDWVKKVYELDIAAHWDQLYEKPGYDPTDL